MDEVKWLQELTRLNASDHVISLSKHYDEDEPIVYCDRDGIWKAGRYVGALSMNGRSLIIEPRFGLPTLANWLCELTSVYFTESLGKQVVDESFIVQLLRPIWANGFVKAARHGLPALSREVATKGGIIRGQLNIRASLLQLAAKGGEVMSERSERSVVHAASDVIVCAYNVLRRGMPNEQWLPQRVKELLPPLIAATGCRPRMPQKSELERIRYTPITAGFAPFVELSRQIASRRGLFPDIEANGKTLGVLLDVAELWELYVLSILQKAAKPTFTVIHGTKDQSARRMLLRSDIYDKELGTLIPDAIIRDERGEVSGIVDAKYKLIHGSINAPQGPQREDLYQMAAYLGRYASNSSTKMLGVLAYPTNPENPAESFAEKCSPWSLSGEKKVVFAALPNEADDAILRMRAVLTRML